MFCRDVQAIFFGGGVYYVFTHGIAETLDMRDEGETCGFMKITKTNNEKHIVLKKKKIKQNTKINTSTPRNKEKIKMFALAARVR